jgi:hypothetical protein
LNVNYQQHKPGFNMIHLSKHRRIASLGLALIGTGAAGMALLKLAISRPTTWSINIYCGDTPFDLRPARASALPVLRAEHIHDIPATFVADPFMVRNGETRYLFFEMMHADTRLGKIGYATSRDGLAWDYQGMVLDEPFHLSYPLVFQWQDAYYMLPESSEDQSVRLYRADPFPTTWSLVGPILQGKLFMDPSPVYHHGMWWLFVGEGHAHDTLRLYYAEELTGPWHEHPRSPLLQGNPHIARPAGRILQWEGRLFRFAQDSKPAYGTQVHMFEITHLSLTDYAERPALDRPLLQPGSARWNAAGMHHVDLHQDDTGRWIACVDGYRPRWSIFGHELFPLKEEAYAAAE